MIIQLPETYTHQLSNGTAIEMVLIKAGRFIMGSEEKDAYDDGKPEHIVAITHDFYIAKYPVTQEVWTAVMGEENPNIAFNEAKRPVERVSWIDINEGNQEDNGKPSFLAALHQAFPITNKILKGFQFRLPTEAEWEYAAKGGHLSPQKDLHNKKAAALYTQYAGSAKLKEVGWFWQNSHNETKEVGQKLPNELDLFDMTGNVLEWCADWFDREFYQKCKDKSEVIENPCCEEGQFRVIRGGSWNLDPQGCRVSCRNGYHPSYRHSYVGFRLVFSFQLDG